MRRDNEVGFNTNFSAHGGQGAKIGVGGGGRQGTSILIWGLRVWGLGFVGLTDELTHQLPERLSGSLTSNFLTAGLEVLRDMPNM